jgi:hypothetical protein
MSGGTNNELKKEAVKAIREGKRTKINRNSFVEAKGRERTEKGWGIGIKMFSLIFFLNCYFLQFENVSKNCQK